MTLTELLKQEVEAVYAVTENLFGMVGDDELGWKPATGKNWMTVGQVVMHCTNACGAAVKGFVTGDWGMPEGMSMDDLKPEDMLPPAEKLPAAGSIDEARKLLTEDKNIAMKYLAEAGEKNLLAKKSAAPWGGPEVTLFQHLLHMIEHLAQHKGQLFYYLKLMGKDVNTSHLWEM
jgi:hypothetical protein